jgi:multidrug efflux system outer membrane protein
LIQTAIHEDFKDVEGGDLGFDCHQTLHSIHANFTATAQHPWSNGLEASFVCLDVILSPMQTVMNGILNSTTHLAGVHPSLRLGVVLLATLGLAGCLGKRTLVAKPNLVAPSLWSNAGADEAQTEAGDLSEWWKRLNDPSLSSLVEQALKNNTDIRTSQSRLREARAERNLANANRFPTLTGSISGTGNKSAAAISGTSQVYSVAFDASWEPDVFGVKRHALNAADADLRTSEAKLQASQVSLTAEVALNYVDVREYQRRLAIARGNQASQAETLQLTEWRSSAGLVSSVDVEQARSNLEQTRALIPTLQTNMEENESRLATLLGVNGSVVKRTMATPALVPSVPDQVAVGIPAETLRQRPDVRAAEQKILAETARLRQSEASRYPSFSLSGSLGIEQLLGSGTTGAVTGGSTIAVLSGGTTALASFAGSVIQTLFDKGRIRQQIKIQDAVQEQAVISYEATVLTAVEEVENALISFQNSRERLTALNQAAEAAHNAAVLARNRYTAGLIDFQTVLDTERSELTLQDSVAQTQAERVTALIQLYKALGGGWSPNGGSSLSAGQGTNP